jgi:hypothetical protein
MKLMLGCELITAPVLANREFGRGPRKADRCSSPSEGAGEKYAREALESGEDGFGRDFDHRDAGSGRHAGILVDRITPYGRRADEVDDGCRRGADIGVFKACQGRSHR